MKKTIVISAINLDSGGTLSILKDSLFELSKNYSSEYRIIALVHSKALFAFENIEFRQYPISKKSWFVRMFYEYIYFYFLSLAIKPDFWLSMHDMTPNVDCKVQAVYCHNITPVYKPKKGDWHKNTKVFLFSKFYRHLYGINIKKNDYVIVQQKWIRDFFKKTWQLKKVVVAYPDVRSFRVLQEEKPKVLIGSDKTLFFYPSLSRPFKNFELVCEAYSLLSESYKRRSSVFLTLDDNANEYAREIVKKYEHIKGISFLGLLPRDEVYSYYQAADCLIFPSKLESWGLPITEFKTLGKPMLLADLPYAKEAVGEYEKVSFFDTNSSVALKKLMESVIDQNIVFEGNKNVHVGDPFTRGWASLFDLIFHNA